MITKGSSVWFWELLEISGPSVESGIGSFSKFCGISGTSVGSGMGGAMPQYESGRLINDFYFYYNIINNHYNII